MKGSGPFYAAFETLLLGLALPGWQGKRSGRQEGGQPAAVGH
jgi:hypothetical protein